MLERFLRFVFSAWLFVLPSSFVAADPPPAADAAALRPEARPAVAAAEAEVTALGASSPPAARAEAWGRLGMLYLHERQLEAAEPCFSAARAAQPDQMRWAYYLAVAQERRGDLKAAADSLRAAMAVREGNLPVVLRLAGVLTALGDTAGAEALYAAAVQSPYGAAAGEAGLGRLALARGDARKAVEHFERALAAQPEADALHGQLALALAATGERERGRQEEAMAGRREVSWPDPLLAQLDFLLRSAPRESGADPRLDSLERAAAANPGDAGARRTLAQAQVQAGDLEGAQEQLEELISRGQAEARDYLELGSVKADRQADPAAGVPDLKKALELDPQLYLAHQRLAHMLLTLGQADEAVEHLEKALAIEPSLVVSRLMLARAYFGLEKLPQAMAATEELLRREPGNLEAILMRGRIYGGLNQPTEARQDFERVAGAAGAAPSQRAEAYFGLGLLQQAASDTEGAIADYRKALDEDSFHVPSLTALSTILSARGDGEGALPLYQRLAMRQPGNLEIKYRLAALQMQRGDAEAAHILFEELYRAQPKVPEFIVTSALLLSEMGQTAAGTARIDQALAELKEPQIRQRLLAARARIESRAGQVDGAVATYRKAIQLGDTPELHLELARSLALAGRYAAALTEYDVYLKARPQDEETQFARAMVLIWAGKWSAARDRLLEVTAVSKNVELTHLLARLLASAPDPQVRNGERALQIATAVFEKERNPAHGETLAMAMAAAGRFPEAVGLQKRLLFEAEKANFDAGFIARVKQNLAHFEKGELAVADW